MNIGKRLRHWARFLLYPGIDLHVRDRARLSRYWRKGARDVLDAGCGNGYFSWLAYRSGARVTALSFDPAQVSKAREFLVEFRGADPGRLTFEQRNLYTLESEQGQFDEIICYEVLEHLQRDSFVLAQFFRILRPGGALHLCCPNSEHPRHRAEVLDLNETGGHVRPGYTEADYRRLLEPLGFRIEEVVGIGSRALYAADEMVRRVRNTAGDFAALPLVPLALPFLWTSGLNPPMPFSFYVLARKPA
jgi:SAM-dependent methyltransferase